MKTTYWFWKNILSKKQCLKINSFIEKNCDTAEHPSSAATGINNKKLKYCDVKLIYWKKVKHLLGDILDNCYSINQQQYGFNLWPMYNVNFINYNIYTPKNQGSYDWHIDALDHEKNADIKFTILINTSTKKYTGGELEQYSHGIHEVKELTPGAVVMMPSYVNHRVKPVINGERKTLAIFLHGPKFI